MANEIIYQGRSSESTSSTIKADLFNPDGTVNATAIALAEVGTTYVFRGDFPASQPAGEYYVRVYDSGAPTVILGQGPMGWDGAKEITLLDVSISRKLLQNDTVTDPSNNGLVTVLDDDNSTTFMTATAYNDAGTVTPYDGTAGVNHRTDFS